MFWFRSQLSYYELSNDDTLLNNKRYLFEIPGPPDAESAACYITRTLKKGPTL